MPISINGTTTDQNGLQRALNRKERAEQYEAHIGGVCGDDCSFCEGTVQEKKNGDDENERDDQLSELPVAFMDWSNVYSERIGICLGYMLYSDNREVWVRRFCSFITRDIIRVGGYRADALPMERVLKDVIANLSAEGPQPEP